MGSGYEGESGNIWEMEWDVVRIVYRMYIIYRVR